MINNTDDFLFREIHIQWPNKFDLGSVVDKSWYTTTKKIYITRDQVILERNLDATIPPFKYGNFYVLYISEKLNLPFNKVILEFYDFKTSISENFDRNIQTNLYFKVINSSEILSKI